MIDDPTRKLKAPAIALLIVGCLNGVTGFLTVLSGLLRLVGVMGKEAIPIDQAEKAGFWFATLGMYGVALVSLLLAPVIVYGAVQMMQGRKLMLAKIAAVLAILPLTSCCCIAGLPVGIWTFIVLSRPEMRALST
jgi:hypothetical protein